MASDYKIQLGQRLKTARLRAGMTQSDLAEKTELSTNHISAIERGVYSTRAEMLARIAGILGADGNYVLFGEPWGKESTTEESDLQRALRMAARVKEEEKMAKYIIAGIELVDDAKK